MKYGGSDFPLSSSSFSSASSFHSSPRDGAAIAASRQLPKNNPHGGLISLIYCHPSAGAIPTSPARPSAPPLRPNGARTQERRSRPPADRPSDRTPPQENQIRCDEFGIRLRCLERRCPGAVGGALFPRRERSGGLSRDSCRRDSLSISRRRRGRRTRGG